MADASVTRLVCALGPRDTYTGWCSKTYTEETVDAVILHQGEVVPAGLSSIGMYAKYPHTIYVPDVIHEDDLIKNQNNDYFLIKSSKERWWLDQFDGYECNAVKIKQQNYANRPATSGTWHADSDSTVTDVRYRMKTWLDDNLADVKEDNGATDATVVCMFAKPDYGLWREFSDEGTDIIIYVEQASCKARITQDHYPYGWDESATLRVCAVDKPTITAARIIEEAEQAIRELATDHPTGSLKSIEAETPADEDLGGMTLYSRLITIAYVRANDDYVATYPRVTYGPSATPTGTYIFPNCADMKVPSAIKDVWNKIPAMSGDSVQVLGSGALDVEFTCDLDMAPSALTWKRPQTTTPKTDATNFDVFIDLMHNEGIDQPYHTLTLQSGGPSFSVRMVSMQPDVLAGGNKVVVRFREYRTTSADALTYKQRLGIT